MHKAICIEDCIVFRELDRLNAHHSLLDMLPQHLICLLPKYDGKVLH
jgi:hypothetical protein